jgi:RNA polymerase sigma-70 factor, ECF subfamily
MVVRTRPERASEVLGPLVTSLAQGWARVLVGEGQAMDNVMSARFQRDAIPLTGQIMATAVHLTGSREDAEDLTQEVMLRAYAGFGSFREGTSLKSWLYRILRNTWRNQYCKKKRRPDEVSVECVSEPQLADAVLRASNASRSTEDVVLESIADGEVATALAALQERIRTTVYYADVLEFSSNEIATVMDCPIRTVESRLYLGRNRLRTRLFELSAALASCLDSAP